MHGEFTQLGLGLFDRSPVPLSRHSGKPRTGQTFACEACGTPFYRFQSDIRKAAQRGARIRYCSKPCENGLKSSTNVERICPACGRSFTVWASRVTNARKLGQSIYCSARCRDDANKGIRTSREVACDVCGKTMLRRPSVIRKRVYCSHACMAMRVADWSRGSKGRGNWGHRDDIGHFVRSAWEANVARALRLLGIPYQFEPRTFRLPNGKAYRPDFLVAGRLWIEVKGRMREQDAAKIAAFRAAYPEETLVVLGEADYWHLEDTIGGLIPAWERPWQRHKPKAA